MQTIDVTEIEPCRVMVQYVADAEEILNKRGEVLESFKKAPVRGFRQGKATLDAIKMQYRPQIEESLKRALAEDAFHNTLFERKLRPHGPPRFTSILLQDGKFTCEFEMHTKPDFDLVDLKTLEVVKPHQQQGELEIREQMMQELRVRFGEATPYTEDDFVQNGDNVVLNYEGFIDGERVDHLCAEGEMLTVGASALEGFDSNVLGMKPDETREFDMKVPETGLASLAGKTVHLKVTVVTGSKNVPAPLDDSLAQKLGKENLDQVRELVNGQASATAQKKQAAEVNQAIAAKLVDAITVQVPNWLTLSEAQYLAQNSKMDWNTMTDTDKEQYMSLAEKNVKLSLILDKAREDNPEAQLTDQEVFGIIKNNLMNTKTEASLDEVIQQMSRSGYLQILFARIRDEYAMDFIGKQVKLVD